ncbi:ABC transporter transmembrane domain-containing protein, partial [Streptococcus sp.]|uniref:ABC transporter transmembrane domain-containing protein n=1 Tax=Streptococcus sp. TaxID=1306 RepID=UPI0025CF723E
MKATNNKSTLRRLSRDILSQRSLLVIATVGTIIQVALTVYLPILIGDAVDAVLKRDAVLLISRLIWQMLAVIVANSAIQWLNPLIYNRLIYSYSESLRERVMMKIHALPLSYLDRQGTGDMVSRVTTDSDQLNNGLLMVFNQFFVGLLTIFVIIITMARLDWFMMLLVLVMTPLSVLVARFIARKSYQLYRHQTKWRGMQTQLIEESLTQEALVQSLNAQSQMVRNFREVNGKYAAYSRGAIFYSSAVNPATRFVNSLIYALIAGVGAYRIMSGGAFTVGQLTTFLNYVTQYTKPFNDISSVLSELQSALACADRLYMILDENEIIPDVKRVLEAIKEYPELEERIISPKEAMKRKKESSLLVMVDYHKPSLSISQELYERFDKVVIIDHHRRGDEFPAKPLLSYIESSASSASELVTELIEYQSNSANKLQAFEATMMLAGIVVDTKSFNTRTTARTFDVASYLRTCGADSSLVQ